MTEFAAETLGMSLLNIAWRSTAVILLAYTATRALPALSASRRREIGLLSLLIVVIMTIATLTNAVLNVRSGPPTSTLSRLVGDRGEIQVLTSFIPATASNWLTIALALWAAGTLFAIARTLHRLYKSGRFVASATRVVNASIGETMVQLAARTGVSPVPRLCQSAAIETAAVSGFWNKTILVSESWANWSTERRVQILTHELCHIANHDLAATLVAQLARALLWWNPTIHVAVRNMTLQQEYVCDEQVVRAGTPADVYAETLLDLAKSSSHRTHNVVLAVAQSSIPERVERVLRIENSMAPAWHRWYSGIAAVVFVGIAFFPGYRVQNDEMAERVIDMRPAQRTESRTVRIDRDAAGNIRVEPVRKH